MSNQVLPTLPGQTLKQGRALTWRNTVLETGSGREFAISHWGSGKRSLRLEYEFLRAGAEQELQQLEAFFNKHKGNADTWLFDDANDRSVVAEPIGVGNGLQASFQMTRSRGGFVEPVYELNGSPLVYLDGNPAGTNLLLNPSFEQGSTVATGWVGYVSGSLSGVVSSLETDSPAFGSKVQRVAASSASTVNAKVGVYQQYGSPSIPVIQAGRIYTLSGLVRYRTGTMAASNLLIKAYISWRNPSGAQVSAASGDVANPTSVFTPASLTMTAPAGATWAYIYFWAEALAVAAGSFSIDIDAAQFVLGAARTDFDASRSTWSVGANGLLTFGPYVPANGVAITATFDYFWRCRFDRSEIEFEQFLHDLWSLRQLEFHTCKP